MVNTPPNKSQDWEKVIHVQKNIIKKLNRMLGVSIEHYIACERVLEPRTIETITDPIKGHCTAQLLTIVMQLFLDIQIFPKKLKDCIFVVEVFIQVGVSH